MNTKVTWHGLDGTDAISGLPGDEGWYLDHDGICANNGDVGDPASEALLNEIRAKAEAGSEFHKRALMAHIKARLLT